MTKSISGKEKLLQEVEIWANTINKILSEQILPDDSILLLKQTPLSMHLLGANIENNLYISPKALAGLVNNQGLSAEILKQVPIALTDPIAVFKTKSTTNYIYMLDVYTYNRATVIVNVEFDAYKSDGSPVTLVQDANAIEKDGAPDNDLLIDIFIERPAYCNKEKWSDWAKKYNNGVHEKTGYYVSNLVRQK